MSISGMSMRSSPRRFLGAGGFFIVVVSRSSLRRFGGVGELSPSL